MPATVSLDDLEHALLWLSMSDYENSAFVCRASGRVFSYGTDGPVEPDAPDEIVDLVDYVAVPDKNELDLGKALVRSFLQECAPHLQDEALSHFRQRGAYAGYKALLARHRLLDTWHAYERQAIQRALMTWALENGLVVSTERGDA